MELFPVSTFDTEIFYNGCKEKKLLFQKCKNCSHIIWPNSLFCPKCYNNNLDLIESEGYGTIYTFTIFRVAFHKAFKDKLPYTVAVIELDEGPKLVSNIVDTPLNEVKIGKKVEVTWDSYGNTFLPKFKVISYINDTG